MSKQSARGGAWQRQRLRVLERDGWTCAYCSRALVGSDATVDHVTPVAMTGSTKYDDHELVAACRRCNGSKADRPLVWLPYRAPDLK